MGKIQKLPETLIRLIAAGEVIERPASVVKELIENSLDAGASSVSIDLLSAGRTRIRVSDDGEGMSKEDAQLALDRHATSKLHAFDDLQAMSTFGFRGEALPSIAAVSRLVLSTRTKHDPEGWSLMLEGGKLLSSRAIGIPQGTTIDVQDLFFNTPARSKFLKRDSTERSHVLKIIQDIALAHPSVRFELSMDGKTMLALARAEALGQRIADLWGLSVAEQLVSLDVQQGPCAIRGYVNAIAAHHPTKAYQTLFVNQRPVQQRALNFAIYEAYREWLPVNRHPIYCLFVDLDPTLIDVNVHPAKREVRISDERATADLLYNAIRNLFKEQPSTFNDAPLNPLSPTRERVGVRGSSPSASESTAALLTQSPITFETTPMTSPLTLTLSHEGRGETAQKASLRYLGQFQKTYLLFEEAEELVLVDQHAASERILYERLLTQVSTEGAARQALLAPLIWDVSPDQAELLRSIIPDLERLGFALEEFGTKSFALKEWPAVLPETKQAKQFLEEILEAFQQEKPGSRTDVQHRIAASAACRAAVMAGDSISTQEVTRLMEDLSACERPATCPHGRPTHIRQPLSDLHRRFRRT